MARKYEPKERQTDTSGDSFELDEIDWKILNELRINGRASFGAIAQKIGLSETATRQRVHRLTKESVCQITVTIDARRVGLDAIASVGLRIEGETGPFLKELAQIPEVSFLASTLGSYDIMAELYCRDVDELASVIEKIRKIKGIRQVDVNLITEMPKFIVNPMISSQID